MSVSQATKTQIRKFLCAQKEFSAHLGHYLPVQKSSTVQILNKICTYKNLNSKKQKQKLLKLFSHWPYLLVEQFSSFWEALLWLICHLVMTGVIFSVAYSSVQASLVTAMATNSGILGLIWPPIRALEFPYKPANATGQKLSMSDVDSETFFFFWLFLPLSQVWSHLNPVLCLIFRKCDHTYLPQKSKTPHCIVWAILVRFFPKS